MLPLYELADAIQWNNPTAAKRALESGADPNGYPKRNISVLHFAERKLATSVVPILAKYGSNLNERVGVLKDSLLHKAARHENIGFIDALLEAGADANAQNLRGETPLHIAAATGQAFLAQSLLKYHASVACRDIKGRTPLDIAIDHGNTEIVRLFNRVVDNPVYDSTFGSMVASTARVATGQGQTRSGFQMIAEAQAQEEKSPAATIWVDKVRSTSARQR